MSTASETPSTSAEVSRWEADETGRVTFLEAVGLARAAVAEVTGLPIDGIAESGSGNGSGWRVVVEVIESPARMGENDLLSAYEVTLSADGAIDGFTRTSRYRREESRGG